MSRRYYDGSGADVSAATIAFMQGGGVNGTLVVADTHWLEYISPGSNSITPANLFMTSAPFPIKVANLQVTAGPTGVQTVNANFLPASIARSSFDYEIGFSDQTVDVTWLVDDSIQINNLGWGFKWALLSGYFDEYPWYIHRAIFTDLPSNGGTLLATTLMWRGFIRDAKADRSQVTITLASLLDIFQQTQVPTQVIQPGSRMPPFFPAGNASVIGGSLGGSFSSFSTPMDIQFNTLAGPFAPISDHALAGAYLTSVNAPPPVWKAAQSGAPFAQIFRLRDNVTDIAGILHIYPYEPINPVSLLGNFGSTYINVYFQSAIGLAGAVAAGFPFVPPPETGF